MLFEVIRDFFVQHVFGGKTSGGSTFGGIIGVSSVNGTQDFWMSNTASYVPCLKDINGNDMLLTLGDWLSTTATIITLVGIVVCAFLFIRWIFKVCSNSILLR